MASLRPQACNWGEFYVNCYRASVGRYPTEWVERTLAGYGGSLSQDNS